jgi:hypothetical protein
MSNNQDDTFCFTSEGESIVHDLYHAIEASWNKTGKRVFAEAGIKIEDSQAICESMCSHSIASVILTHKGRIDPNMLASFVFEAATKLNEKASNARTH